MSNYILKPIGEVAEIRRGASPRPIDDWMSPVGIPWVKISDATKDDSRFIYKTEGFIKENGRDKSVEVFPEDLIISNSATPGLPKIMKIHACIHDGWLLASDFNGVTRDYLFYQVKYLRKYLVNQGNGSIFTNLKTDILKEFPILIPLDNSGNPDVAQQEKIVASLIAIEDKIEINNDICADLEAMAKLLYDYWFVQFDFPDENGKPYKSSGGKMVWNEELKREIPEGWEVKHSLDLAQTVTGKEDANFATVNGDYAYFTCGSDVLRCDEYKFEGKAVLIAGNGDFNVKYYDGKFNAYQRTYVLIPEDKYIGLLYRSAINKIAQFSRGSNGSIVKFITKSDVDGIEVLVPTDEMLMEPFNNFLDRIQQLHFENQELASLRDFLLPMLMNGQVKVGGAAGA